MRKMRRKNITQRMKKRSWNILTTENWRTESIHVNCVEHIVKKNKKKKEERNGTTHNLVLFNKNLIYCSQQTISVWCLLITNNILMNYPSPPYKGRFPGSSNMQSHRTIEPRLKTTTKTFESFALGVYVSVVLRFGKRQYWIVITCESWLS